MSPDSTDAILSTIEFIAVFISSIRAATACDPSTLSLWKHSKRELILYRSLPKLICSRRRRLKNSRSAFWKNWERIRSTFTRFENISQTRFINPKASRCGRRWRWGLQAADATAQIHDPICRCWIYSAYWSKGQEGSRKTLSVGSRGSWKSWPQWFHWIANYAYVRKPIIFPLIN